MNLIEMFGILLTSVYVFGDSNYACRLWLEMLVVLSLLFFKLSLVVNLLVKFYKMLLWCSFCASSAFVYSIICPPDWFQG